MCAWLFLSPQLFDPPDIPPPPPIFDLPPQDFWAYSPPSQLPVNGNPFHCTHQTYDVTQILVSDWFVRILNFGAKMFSTNQNAPFWPKNGQKRPRSLQSTTFVVNIFNFLLFEALRHNGLQIQESTWVQLCVALAQKKPWICWSQLCYSPWNQYIFISLQKIHFVTKSNSLWPSGLMPKLASCTIEYIIWLFLRERMLVSGRIWLNLVHHKDCYFQ